MASIIRRLSRSSSSSATSDKSTDATSVSSGQSSKVKAGQLETSFGSAAPNSRRLASPGAGSPPGTPTSSSGNGGRHSRSGSRASNRDEGTPTKSVRSTAAVEEDDGEPASPKSKRKGSLTGGLVAAASGTAVGSKLLSKKKSSEAQQPAEPPSATESESESSEEEAPARKSKPIIANKKASSTSSSKNGKKVNGVAAGSKDDDDDSSVEYYSSPDSGSISDETQHDGRRGSGSESESEGEDDDVAAGKGKNRPKINSTKPRRKKMGKPLNKLTFQDVQLTDKDLRTDINEIWDAMHLFMNSRMIEAEDICLSAADHRLYFSVGYTLIQCIKSLMTFEPEDLEAAIQCCRDSLVITQHLRKKDSSMYENVGKLVKGTISSGGIAKMTGVQRHAELVFAECLLLKAVLGIIYSGDFVAFLKEALNMRSAYATYRALAKYVEDADAKAGGEDESIDQDFRSGVFLGNGLISLILSLLPGKVLKIMEVFGFTGDREYALRTLQKAGGWSNDPKKLEPSMDPKKEGIRRQICDMALLFHHLLISTYLPVTGVDIRMADKILHYNLDRYPEGVFFLYFAGRLYTTQTISDKAVKQFGRAINAQREYIQLQHICHWDLALTHMATADWDKANQCFKILDKESNWSKAIYAYALAVTSYEAGADPKAVGKIMATVPDLMQRIAGKSIPLEKFVARKSKKFVQQGNRLVCPGLELAYFLNALGMSPRFALFENHLDSVSAVLGDLHHVKEPAQWGTGEDYWDDYCLAHLLRGIVLRFIAFPEDHTKPRPAESPIPQREAAEQAEMSLRNVFKHGPKVMQDHQVVWFAHYELGRLYANKGNDAAAAEQYGIVLNHPKDIETSKKSKGKVSLQNMCLLRANAANESMKEMGKASA